MTRLLLTNGASPNEECFAVFYGLNGEVTGYTYSTVWGLFLQHLRGTNASPNYSRLFESIRDAYEVTKLLIEYDASADLWPWRNILTNDVFRSPRSTLERNS